MRQNLRRMIATMVFGAVCVPAAFAQNNWTHPRIISVTGTAVIRVTPDRVRLMLGVDSRDRDLVAAKANNDERVRRLMAQARSAGVDSKNIKTSALTMRAEYSDEKIPRLVDYDVSQTVMVTLADISKYDDLMTSLLKAGVNRVDGIDFFVAEPKKYEDEARLEAIRDAREKANAMAAELGQKIGNPWEISEEGEAGVPIALNAVMSRTPMQPEEPTIAGGQVALRSSVRISFQLE